jgi:hypothetical protein
MPSEALAELAFEQSQRRLDKQERVGSGWNGLAVVAAVLALVALVAGTIT